MSHSTMEPEDKNHRQTIRREMITLLCEREMGAREISQIMGIREKVVYEHLTHMARTMAAKGQRLLVLPFKCLDCGYVFKERTRFTPPGRCPRCKRSHLERPAYRIM